MSVQAQRAGVHGRVSDDKSGTGRSVTEQQDDNRAACAANGWKVAEEYEDLSLSASRFARKPREDWLRLQDDIKTGRLDVVVLWESSRGSRKAGEWMAFLDACRDHSVKVHITTHRRSYDMAVPRDWRTLAEDGVDSAYESEKTSLRIKRSLEANARDGRPHGPIPYGYERRYDPRTKALAGQLPDPVTAPAAREIIERVAGGDPVSAIVASLNGRGVPSPSGGRWGRTQVRRIATNPVYAGKREHGAGGLVEAIWPPLVDEVTAQAARRVLGDASRKTTRPGSQKHLLSYLAVCGKCGGHLAVHGRRTGRTPYMQYACQVSCVAMAQVPVDWFVTELALRRLAQPDFHKNLTAGGDGKVLAARAEAAGLRERHDKLAAAAAAGEITMTLLAKTERELLPAIGAAEARATALVVPLPLRQLAEPGADIGERWGRLPVAARREVLRHLFTRVALAPAVARGGTAPDFGRIQVEWRNE